MGTYHVRLSGNVYGPFTGEQLQQLATSGRINNQAEISTAPAGQPHSWMPAASVLGQVLARPPQGMPLNPNTGGAASASSSPAGGDSKKYLEALRNRTRYPFYRTTILVCSILGYIVAVLPIVGLIVKVAWTGLSSVEIYEPFAAFLAAGFIAVFVTVAREMFSMYADFVDSTIEHHARRT